MAYPLHLKKARGAKYITVHLLVCVCLIGLSSPIFAAPSLEPKLWDPKVLSACTQACQKECRNNDTMRPFATHEGLVGVGRATCCESCTDLCQRNQKTLQTYTKTLMDPIAQFVLDFYATSQCFPEENSLFYRGKQWAIQCVEFLRGF